MDAQAIMDGVAKALGYLLIGGVVSLAYQIGKNDYDMKKAVELATTGAVWKRAA